MPRHCARPVRGSRGRLLATTCLLVGMVLVSGCVTTGVLEDGGGGGWVEEARGAEEAAREAALEAEAALAVERVWALAREVREPGAELSLTFWSERGALTLTGYGARGREARASGEADGQELRQGLEAIFTRYVRGHTGEVRVVLRRRERGWAVGYEARGFAPRPPEARTLPLRYGGVPGETVQALSRGVSQLMGAVQVPSGGAATVELEVLLEDGRVEGWELRGFEVTRAGERGPFPALSPSTEAEVIQVLLPFTAGIGERTVRLRLLLEHGRGDARAGGHVVSAEVVRPPPPPGWDEDFAAEYRALHEDILRRWREETREGAEWVARRGVEELAVWFAGGIIARGAGLFAAKAVPTVMRALGRGGETAAGWLRSATARMPGEERKAFERLWAKVQLEGPRALSSAERQELRMLMEGLERLVRNPLENKSKDVLRRMARRQYETLRPDLAPLMELHPTQYPIHHRRPLQYAHLFPDQDINAAENLVMLREAVHGRVNALWIRFRQLCPHATAKDVDRVTRAIDARFKYWYHRADEPVGAPYSLGDAEAEVLRELNRLFAGGK